MMCTIDHKVVKFKNQKQTNKDLTIFMFIVLLRFICYDYQTKTKNKEKKQPKISNCNKADRGKNLVLKIEGGLNNQTKNRSSYHPQSAQDFQDSKPKSTWSLNN